MCEGRAVGDPQDATLAVAWARRLQLVRWPRWFLPRTRPRGWHAALWILHTAWILVAVFLVIVLPSWRSGGVVRWVVVGAVAYSAIGMPWVFTLIFRMRWNAPEAERKNVALLR